MVTVFLTQTCLGLLVYNQCDRCLKMWVPGQKARFDDLLKFALKIEVPYQSYVLSQRIGTFPLFNVNCIINICTPRIRIHTDCHATIRSGITQMFVNQVLLYGLLKDQYKMESWHMLTKDMYRYPY